MVLVDLWKGSERGEGGTSSCLRDWSRRIRRILSVLTVVLSYKQAL